MSVALRREEAPRFWDAGSLDGTEISQAVERLVDAEAYRVVESLLSEPTDPDFVSEGIWPSGGGSGPGDGWGLRLLVEGRGRSDIVKYFDCARLIREEMESDMTQLWPGDGVALTSSGKLDARSAPLYRLLVERLRASADEIERALPDARPMTGEAAP